jgi:prepilin-type N-terminal cleavage/methylation domain-containing protein
MQRATAPNRAFTLIEVLVVVAVIALLIGILMPSLRNAREQSRRLVCRNNLRNLWTGILTYTLEWRDRLPYIEDVNKVDPDADPFDRKQYPNAVGSVLSRYVQPEAWVCSSAIAGWPANAGRGGWTLTYEFSSATLGGFHPYDEDRFAYTGKPLDPAVANYYFFDARPIRLLDGRRYTPAGLNQNKKGRWSVRFPIIADAVAGAKDSGTPRYPHRGQLAARTDLGQYRPQFETNTNGPGYKTGYHELHADRDKVSLYFTRWWQPHEPGY